MSEEILLQLAGVLILGIAVQWIAWRFRLPAILLLLFVGLLLGPASTGLARLGLIPHTLLDVDALFGDLLLPAVSLAVALILFEGGLSLNLREHRAASGVIWLLVTLGALITFAVASLAARFLLAFDWPLALLLGAILVVTGPTVIGPLLRHVRPGGKVGTILKWEGIIIDPMGAMVAIVVFESIDLGQFAALPILKTALTIIGIGTLCGVLAAAVILLFFRRRWVPDFLQNSFVLAMVLAAFAGANIVRHDSGLFAATLMGLILANQRRVSVHHVVEFKETLSILLISALFIVLAARLTPELLAAVPWGRMLLFLAVLIVIARPLSVYACTCLSSLSWPERIFLGALAPRGIVAASVASVFALRMDKQHFQNADILVPITFATIIGTVTLYGLAAAPLARRLGLSRPGVQGFLITGAGPFERLLAAAFKDEGQPILLVDTNRENIAAARLQGFPVLHGSVLSQFVIEETQLSPISRLLALTPNDEVNALATLRYQRIFSSNEVYQLTPAHRDSARQEKITHELRGRILFGPDLTYDLLDQRIATGQVIRKTLLTPEFTFQHFTQSADPDALPLFLRTAQGQIQLFTADYPPKPHPGDLLFSLAPAKSSATSPNHLVPHSVAMPLP